MTRTLEQIAQEPRVRDLIYDGIDQLVVTENGGNRVYFKRFRMQENLSNEDCSRDEWRALCQSAAIP